MFWPVHSFFVFVFYQLFLLDPTMTDIMMGFFTFRSRSYVSSIYG